jgi:ABC-2 type transport system permease protein
MPIFDQGYQHWEGKLSGHTLRWLPIARQGVRAQMKNRWARLVTLFALIPALLLAGFLILWGLIEQKSKLVAPLLPLFQGILSPQILADPKGFRTTIWTIAFQFFFSVQMTFAMILVLLIGPNLISQDLRFNAIPLYFSRPLRRLDYFVGKLGIIAVFLGAVAIVPAVIAYVLGVCFSLDPNVAVDTARIVGAAVLYGAIIVVSAGTLMLAFSSLSRNSRYVAIIWFGFWAISNGAAGSLVELFPMAGDNPRNNWCYLVSYTTNLERIGGALLDTRSAWDKIAKVVEGDQPAGPDSGYAGGPPPGPGMNAPGGPPVGGPERVEPARPPGPRRGARSEVRPRPPPRTPGQGPAEQVRALAGPSYPWYWSAGVLAGLFGLSLWILSLRVRSLDRLK